MPRGTASDPAATPDADAARATADPWTQPSPIAQIVGYRLVRAHAVGARRRWPAGHETADKAETELFARTGAAMEPIWG